MEITTRFNIGDNVFLIENMKAYKGTIKNLSINIDNEGKVNKSYTVRYSISDGLFDTRYCQNSFNEDAIFSNKEEVKNKLEEIKNTKEKYIENNNIYGTNDYCGVSAYYSLNDVGPTYITSSCH